jgi:FkbM family methyltransferase
MPTPPHKIAFLLAASDQGTFIVNRLDYHSAAANGSRYGVGIELLDNGSYAAADVGIALQLLDLRRKKYGDGVVAIDCGANIGTHTVAWARHMTGWGSVLAIEAQERIYYALAGNIAINNCFNARALNVVASTQRGVVRVPIPDYLQPASFGSLEIKQRDQTEFIGQKIDYSPESMNAVAAVSIDSLQFKRVDLIKIDVEGMEAEVLEGATKCIPESRPVLMVEWIKNDKTKLKSWIESRNYRVLERGMNLVAVHQADKILDELKL